MLRLLARDLAGERAHRLHGRGARYPVEKPLGARFAPERHGEQVVPRRYAEEELARGRFGGSAFQPAVIVIR